MLAYLKNFVLGIILENGHVLQYVCAKDDWESSDVYKQLLEGFPKIRDDLTVIVKAMINLNCTGSRPDRLKILTFIERMFAALCDDVPTRNHIEVANFVEKIRLKRKEVSLKYEEKMRNLKYEEKKRNLKYEEKKRKEYEEKMRNLKYEEKKRKEYEEKPPVLQQGPESARSLSEDTDEPEASDEMRQMSAAAAASQETSFGMKINSNGKLPPPDDASKEKDTTGTNK
jgi:hypothetical protein